MPWDRIPVKLDCAGRGAQAVQCGHAAVAPGL